MVKRLILLGASGNIGEQTLEVLKEKHTYDLVAFSVGKNTNKIKSILKDHKEVKAVYLINQEETYALQNQYPDIKFYHGKDGIVDMIHDIDCDLVLNALVGFVGLKPTLKVIDKGVNLALANKESLVVGGELVNKALKKSNTKIIPVDSEHSAIYKCFKKCKRKDVEEILVTASGGAFRNKNREELKYVTKEEALNHPTWKMGKRVTIDSASMLNKGFELIEAYYLFDFPMKKINILMHDESYIHSVLRLKNGNYIGEVNAPSMKNPIRYALNQDEKELNDVKEVRQLPDFGNFHFRSFNELRYPMVGLALKAFKKGGTLPCVLNAVDEEAVNLFLDGKISFLEIEKIVELALDTFKSFSHPTYSMLENVDREAREWAKTAVKLLEENL